MARKQNKAERQARYATPKAPPPTLTRDQLYEIAKEHSIPGASKLTKDQLVAALAQQDIPLVAPVPRTAPTPAEAKRMEATRIAQAAEVHQARLTDPNAPQADTDRGKRLKVAREEQAALKDWQLGGEQGPRPDTPNYDFIAAQYVAGGAKQAKRSRRMRAGVAARSSSVPSTRSPRGVEALKAKKNELGGKVPDLGTPMSDAEMDALIIEVHAAHPESSWLDEYRYARFVDRRGVTRGRWQKAWDRLFPPGAEPDADVEEPDEDPVIENPTAEAVAEALDAEVVATIVAAKATSPKRTAKKQPVKNPPAKKQPARKQPAKKAAPVKRATKQVTPRFKQGGKK